MPALAMVTVPVAPPKMPPALLSFTPPQPSPGLSQPPPPALMLLL